MTNAHANRNPKKPDTHFSSQILASFKNIPYICTVKQEISSRY